MAKDKGEKMTKKKTLSKELVLGDTKLEFNYGYLRVNGKWYKHKFIDGKETYVEISDDAIKAKLSLARKIVPKLMDNLDKEKILMESLVRLDDKDLEILSNMLFKSKKKYKPKTRSDACVDMKIGNFILPIVD